MSPFHLEQLTDAPVVGRHGQKLGTVADVYVDQLTGRPEWLLVQTGLPREGETFVPLARAIAQGEAIQVPYSRDQVQDAPKVDPNAELSLEEQDRLYEHYDLAFAGRSGAEVDEGSRDAAQAGPAAVGRDGAMAALEKKLWGDALWTPIVGNSPSFPSDVCADWRLGTAQSGGMA